MSTKTTPITSWDDLNDRQRAYLQAIYDHDQVAEANERSKWKYMIERRPADEWRWLYYGDTAYGMSSLKSQIHYQGLVDQGTGATFEALRSRGLILVQSYHSQARGDLSSVKVRMTPAWRRLIRAATGESRPKKLPVGTLRSWHWAALALLYRARALESDWSTGEYFAIDDNDHDYRRGVRWETIVRLRDYKWGALCRENFSHFQTFPVEITPFGRAYYVREWERYRQLYPEVDAPAPS
jgi:hypothetical protein